MNCNNINLKCLTSDQPFVNTSTLSQCTRIFLVICVHAMIVINAAVRLSYLRSINSQEGLAHRINRKNILKDVIGLYRDSNIINEYPIVIKFVGEIGIDAGGIQRDMFSSFWTETYSRVI